MKTLKILVFVFIFSFGFMSEIRAVDSNFDNETVNKIFPSWSTNVDNPVITGVIGHNQDLPGDITLTGNTSMKEKLLLLYIPALINILLKFVAPIVMAVCIWAGLRFIYAGSDEEELTKAKDFFTYALMGVLFIVISYSLMKSLYYILSLP